jgi:cobalt/nickel transport system permease protein
LTYRFTFVMIETLENLVKAALSRGANFSEFWSNKRLYARTLGMTMLSAIEQSERLVKSMEARGYDGDLTLYGDVSRPPIYELLLVIGSYTAVVSYAAVAVYGVGL